MRRSPAPLYKMRDADFWRARIRPDSLTVDAEERAFHISLRARGNLIDDFGDVEILRRSRTIENSSGAD